MIPYLMQEHVAQVLSLLKMQLTYLGDESEGDDMTRQLPAITELLGRCIHTLRDLHTIDASHAFQENWVQQLSASIRNLQEGYRCQISFQISGNQSPVNHQRAVILYRVLLTAANHMIILCREGHPVMELSFSDNSINAIISNASEALKAPAWMQLSMEFLKHQAAIIDAELQWNFSEKQKENKIMLKLAL